MVELVRDDQPTRSNNGGEHSRVGRKAHPDDQRRLLANEPRDALLKLPVDLGRAQLGPGAAVCDAVGSDSVDDLIPHLQVALCETKVVVAAQVERGRDTLGHAHARMVCALLPVHHIDPRAGGAADGAVETVLDAPVHPPRVEVLKVVEEGGVAVGCLGWEARRVEAGHHELERIPNVAEEDEDSVSKVCCEGSDPRHRVLLNLAHPLLFALAIHRLAVDSSAAAWGLCGVHWKGGGSAPARLARCSRRGEL
mmetsp:Transcript_30937/g.72328  ORF Transcript_30937/g.72328 Transcript_30937/m.72328 type:complete len:252 (-) Transcript_30937:183-938(-)